MSVTVPGLLTAMAAKIATVPGVMAAHYPVPKTIPHGPMVVLYWGGDGDTEITMDIDARTWVPVVKAQILTPMKGNTPEEFGVIDGLITPIVDLFDRDMPNRLMPSLTGNVHACKVTRVRPTLEIMYAGQQFYGAELYWTIKFRRMHEVTP